MGPLDSHLSACHGCLPRLSARSARFAAAAIRSAATARSCNATATCPYCRPEHMSWPEAYGSVFKTLAIKDLTLER